MLKSTASVSFAGSELTISIAGFISSSAAASDPEGLADSLEGTISPTPGPLSSTISRSYMYSCPGTTILIVFLSLSMNFTVALSPKT